LGRESAFEDLGAKGVLSPDYGPTHPCGKARGGHPGHVAQGVSKGGPELFEDLGSIELFDGCREFFFLVRYRRSRDDNPFDRLVVVPVLVFARMGGIFSK
jgi:hypothetical protein